MYRKLFEVEKINRYGRDYALLQLKMLCDQDNSKKHCGIKDRRFSLCHIFAFVT